MPQNDDLISRIANGGDVSKEDIGSKGTSNNNGGLRPITESADGLRVQVSTKDDNKK